MSLKTFLPILAAVILLGCNPQPEKRSPEKSNGDFKIKIIDSCEYIEYDYGVLDQRVYSLTHKGNCRFCAERKQ